VLDIFPSTHVLALNIATSCFAVSQIGFFKSKYGDKKRAAEEEREWGEAMKPLNT